MIPAQVAGDGVGRRDPLIECVPNVSEGRDPIVIRHLADSVKRGGAHLVDVHSDVDHHRSVFTFMGSAEVVERSLLELAREAVRLIDLRGHRGVHPRVGAIDVIPFVPLCGATMRDAIAAAHAVGLAFAAECDVPVFFYGAAAARRDRRELPTIRRGGFERLAERLCAPGWRPDAGPSAPHPTAGVSVIGARGPLVAFNALLDTDNANIAGAIARTIRESSGGLPSVQAMGVFLASRGAGQVSMNLLDYRVTPPQEVAERIEAEAGSYGTSVREYELVGCAPLRVFEAWPAGLARIANLKPAQLLESSLFLTHA
jgi:glutamate formiminotransferase / 5-formyltetrahydrofolate cyclo-ligase